jgi:hypothetical protein
MDGFGFAGRGLERFGFEVDGMPDFVKAAILPAAIAPPQAATMPRKICCRGDEIAYRDTPPLRGAPLVNPSDDSENCKPTLATAWAGGLP